VSDNCCAMASFDWRHTFLPAYFSLLIIDKLTLLNISFFLSSSSTFSFLLFPPVKSGGDGALARDEFKAVERLLLAADKGNVAEAQRALGGMYRDGHCGVRQNHPAALAFLARAANQVSNMCIGTLRK